MKNEKSQSILSKKNWENPEYRRKTLEGIKRRDKNPDNTKKRSDGMKKIWADPAFHENQSKSIKLAHNRPSMRKRKSEIMIEAHNRPGYNEHLSEKASEQWTNDPNYVIKTMNFYYGDVDKIVRPAYAPVFRRNRSKKETLSKFEWKCQFVLENGTICGKTKAENIDRLGIHKHPHRHHIFPHTKNPYKIENMTEHKMNLVRKTLPPEIINFGDPDYSDEEKRHIEMIIPLCNEHHQFKEIQREERKNIPYKETKYRKMFTETILDLEK